MSRGRAGSVRSMRRPIFALSRRLMPKPGIARSRQKRTADSVIAGFAALLASTAVAREELRLYAIAGDAIPASLTGATGDPVRGRTVVIDRRLGACLLCHTGPLAEEKFQGT